MNTASHQPARVVLEGVPEIGYHKHLCPFAGSLHACLEYLDDPCDYDFIMAVTGAAFRRLYQRDDPGSIDLMRLSPEPHTRIFRALGYSFKTVRHDDKATMINAVKESIGRGYPVLAFGIIGPPECGIITGYDLDGEVLIGYSYFQDAIQGGYFEKPDWFETMQHGRYGLILLGSKKKQRPSDRQTFISALEWAVNLEHIARRPSLPDHASGLAAYDAWADSLEVDDDFPENDLQVLEWRLMIHCDQCTMLDERRSAARFLWDMRKIAPEAADQLAASAVLYEEVAGFVSGIWLWSTEACADAARGLADARTRRTIAGYIRAAGLKEAKAVEQLDNALLILREQG